MNFFRPPSSERQRDTADRRALNELLQASKLRTASLSIHSDRTEIWGRPPQSVLSMHFIYTYIVYTIIHSDGTEIGGPPRPRGPSREETSHHGFLKGALHNRLSIADVSSRDGPVSADVSSRDGPPAAPNEDARRHRAPSLCLLPPMKQARP